MTLLQVAHFRQLLWYIPLSASTFSMAYTVLLQDAHLSPPPHLGPIGRIKVGRFELVIEQIWKIVRSAVSTCKYLKVYRTINVVFLID